MLDMYPPILPYFSPAGKAIVSFLFLCRFTIVSQVPEAGTDDGKIIKGMNIFLADPINTDYGGEGESAKRVYITNRKLEDCGYMPMIGDSVDVDFDEYKKVKRIRSLL